MYLVSGKCLSNFRAMHMTSCRNFISTEYSASAVFVAFWLVLLFKKRKNLIQFIVRVRNITVYLYLEIFKVIFEFSKLYSFEKLSLSLRLFLKFYKFQPRCSYKIYFHEKSVGEGDDFLFILCLVRTSLQINAEEGI